MPGAEHVGMANGSPHAADHDTPAPHGEHAPAQSVPTH
jgi:hypothetical protein